MEVLYIVSIVVFIIFLIIIIPFAIKRKREHLSGQYGERKTSELLSGLQSEDEEIINDYIASRNRKNSSSIQIDHIFISHKGIFVIETKDYRGRIYGSKEQNNWTQVLAYGEVKNKLYNPIKQNETHCQYVGRLLDWKYPIYNVVIFIKADIKRVSGASGFVFDPYSFRSWYKYMSTNPKMTSQAIQTIKQQILSEMNRMQITKEEHIRNVQNRHDYLN